MIYITWLLVLTLIILMIWFDYYYRLYVKDRPKKDKEAK